MISGNDLLHMGPRHLVCLFPSSWAPKDILVAVAATRASTAVSLQGAKSAAMDVSIPCVAAERLGPAGIGAAAGGTVSDEVAGKTRLASDTLLPSVELFNERASSCTRRCTARFTLQSSWWSCWPDSRSRIWVKR